VKTNFEENLPIIEADPTHLRQIAMNLITNASDALGSEAGTIVLSTGKMEADRSYLNDCYLAELLEPGPYVYLEVEDTGCGMDEETQLRIFDPFFTTKFKGRGLGLAAVLGLVRGHGGALRVRSAKGEGTAFRVLFPVSINHVAGEESASALPELEVISNYCGKGTILVIDDEPIVRSVAQEMLESAGFKVLTAESGQQGIECFKLYNDEIVAVLLDMTMPDLNGEQVYRELLKFRSEARVIISSGYSEIESLREIEKQGRVGYLQKPYVPEALIEKVREAIGN
jgi:CheY-like chemotaxis protein